MKSIARSFAALLSLWLIGPPPPTTLGQLTGDVHGMARAGDRPAPDTVVWLDVPNAPPRPENGRVVLDQRNLSFSPHVLVVRVGTTVDFPNNDRVFHNVFSFHAGKQF